MAYEFYIQPNEYEIAEHNGISKGTLEQRIRDLGWHKEKATSTPPREQKSLKEWQGRSTTTWHKIPNSTTKNKWPGMGPHEGRHGTTAR